MNNGVDIPHNGFMYITPEMQRAKTRNPMVEAINGLAKPCAYQPSVHNKISILYVGYFKGSIYTTATVKPHHCTNVFLTIN